MSGSWRKLVVVVSAAATLVTGFAATPAAGTPHRADVDAPALQRAVATPREATGNCDFNGDRFEDLPVGAPFDDGNGTDRTVADAGVIDIGYGSRRGIRRGNTWFLTNPAPGDRFGSASVCADFNNDGIDDLAIGAPSRAAFGVEKSGIVVILYGHASAGLDTFDTLGRCFDPNPAAPNGCNHLTIQVLHQGLRGVVLGRPNPGDRFGYEMTWGNFDGDNFFDLVIASPGERVGGHAGAGMVQVLYGSNQGLIAKYGRQNQVYHQDIRGLATAAGPGEAFGEFISGADFNGDGIDDVAIGVPREDVGGVDQAGIVHVLFGRRNEGLTNQGQAFSQASRGVATDPGTGDWFGSSLAWGDFDGNGAFDLVVGAIGEPVNGKTSAGAVHVLFGVPVRGLTGRGSQFVNLDTGTMKGAAAREDHFGSAMVAGYFNNDDQLDLALGIPGKDVNGKRDAGAVSIVFGNGRGLGKANQLWHLDLDVAQGSAKAGDLWGASLLWGYFYGSAPGDLVVGAPMGDLRRGKNTGFAQMLVSGRKGPRAGIRLYQNAVTSFDPPEAGDAWGMFSVPNPRVFRSDLLDRTGGGTGDRIEVPDPWGTGIEAP